MALINCHECGREVSDSASLCPGCGAPIPTSQLKKSDRVPYSDQEVAIMLSKKKKTSHILHLILSVITGGLWIIIWVLVAISNSSDNSKIESQIKKGKKVK
ncbi:zinc-ribbon domain-containing protein [Geopsychrobacter electrodiphilus]|uniref:zinc-ribbon domain-containing protein n=1 Tax=Geopsychrobacter electrodiphilus TaxID=225196 RepID=UPI0012EBFC1E|nr:zinc-ribbon domain-containing protein [Geopsychrobacter electrodiphilus]